MSSTAIAAADSIAGVAEIPVVPIRQIAPWALFGALLALVALYFVGAEQGAVSLLSGSSVHEWVHDGRHLLGFPCH